MPFTFNRTPVYVASALMISLLAGCSSTPLDTNINYQGNSSSNAQPSNNLDIPPDLSQLPADNTFVVPSINSASAENTGSPTTITASSYKAQQAEQQVQQTTDAAPVLNKMVAPGTLGDIKVMRDGNIRWLVIQQSPQILWPQVEEFWKKQGFALPVDDPQVGIMETNWLENRANIPNDIIRRTLGKLIDSLYDTGLRDKYRTRLERDANGASEIYISHRGMTEVLTGSDKTSSMWTERKPDPGLEAAMLTRLMIFLGTDKAKAEAEVKAPEVIEANVKEIKKDGVTYLELGEPMDRAWRKVGLVLDRSNFVVEDRDRSRGLYFVQYRKPDAFNKNEENFFTKLFSSSKDKPADHFQIHLQATGEITQINVLDIDGKPDSSEMAGEIVTILKGQLK